MSESRFAALAEISAVMPPGMRLLAGFVRSNAAMVNCVIFASEPVGVHDVSAMEFVQITASTKISGKEMKARNHGTPKKACDTAAPSTARTGTATADIHSGSSMDLSTSGSPVPAAGVFRLKRPRKSSGLPARLTSEPTTIIATAHQRDHWLTISAREIATTAPLAATRGAMSPCRIMSGARMTKLMNAPSRQLVATRMPIRPPTPTIDRSSVSRSPSWRKSVPRMDGVQR